MVLYLPQMDIFKVHLPPLFIVQLPSRFSLLELSSLLDLDPVHQLVSSFSRQSSTYVSTVDYKPANPFCQYSSQPSLSLSSRCLVPKSSLGIVSLFFLFGTFSSPHASTSFLDSLFVLGWIAEGLFVPEM